MEEVLSIRQKLARTGTTCSIETLSNGLISPDFDKIVDFPISGERLLQASRPISRIG